MAKNAPRIPLPEDWPHHVRAGIIHVISLAQVALTAARARAKKRGIAARLRAMLEERDTEISLLKKELELKDLRMGRVKPRRRPHYRGTERLRILELKAGRCWSKAQAAERLLLRPATIAGWTKRLDEEGEAALLQTPEPINRFPDFVRHICDTAEGPLPVAGDGDIRRATRNSAAGPTTEFGSRCLLDGAGLRSGVPCFSSMIQAN